MKKSNVVIIRNAYQHDFGGAERFPVFLAEHIRGTFEPSIITRSKKLIEFARSRHINVKRGWWWSRQNWSGLRMLFYPVYVAWQIALTGWYLRLFRHLKPSVIHIQSKDDFIAASIAGKLCGAKVIWTDHADLKHVFLHVNVPFRNLVGKTVLWAARFADTITVVSQSELGLVRSALRQYAERLDNKLVVVYNGVSDTYDQHHRADKPQGSVFCVASRLVADKGIGEVINAFMTVQKKHPDSRLIIMGDGPEATRFKDMAATHKAIEFLGHVSQPLDVMAKSNIFVHPTYHEGFSVALVEASMLGLPIIATDVGGNREIIIDGRTGLLVPAKDPDQLARAMTRLIEDRTLRQTLGDAARRQYEEKFEFDAIVKNNFLPLYTEK